MKKLNRKGFTLVELLAVIVILAIVVGIAIPSVTKIINASKRKAFETTMETAGSYLIKQSQLLAVDASAMDPVLKSLVTSGSGSYLVYRTSSSGPKRFKALGLKTDDIEGLHIQILESGTACIKVIAIPKTSKYYIVDDWELITDGMNYYYDYFIGYYKPKNPSKAMFGSESCSY